MQPCEDCLIAKRRSSEVLLLICVWSWHTKSLYILPEPLHHLSSQFTLRIDFACLYLTNHRRDFTKVRLTGLTSYRKVFLSIIEGYSVRCCHEEWKIDSGSGLAGFEAHCHKGAFDHRRHGRLGLEEVNFESTCLSGQLYQGHFAMTDFDLVLASRRMRTQ